MRLMPLPFLLFVAAACVTPEPRPTHPTRVGEIPPGHPHDGRVDPVADHDVPSPDGNASSATGTSTGFGLSTGGGDAVTVRNDPPPPNPPQCPATFGGGALACDRGRATPVCTYPQGTCACQVPQWCSGVAPPRDRPRQWTCNPVCGQPGTPCDSGAVCGSRCCGMQVACVNGTWQQRMVPCPP